MGGPSDSIFKEFIKKDLVIDSIKRLGEVKNNANNIMAPLQGVDNFVHEGYNGHMGGMVFPKTELVLI